MLKVGPLDARTTILHLQKRTGIQFIEYNCCINSCMCYGAFPSYNSCTYCGEDRYQDGNPRNTFQYIPLTHRLKMQYADPARARKLTNYRASVEARGAESEEGLAEDFWNGSLYRDQRAKGLWSQRTDIGLFFSTDGVRVFKTRTNFQ
ncbi:hypothetical protein DFP73DRAFT_487982, partial [Morchella snyderi]